MFDLTDAMRADMQRETAALVEDVVFTRSGSLKDLLTADYTFVNASLAKHYGIAGVTGTDFVKAQMPHDPGILAHGSMMAGHGGIVYSSPTLRGKLVRTRLLCENLPPPPDDVDTMIKAPENAKTTRQIFQAHVENPVCGPCHQTMDPIGFGFEQYDVVGRFRTQENGVPVDATGEIVGPGLKFNGLKELVDHLADNDAVRQCMVRFMAYSSYGAAGWADDGCTYDAISNEAKSQNWSIRSHADRHHAGATLHHPGSVGGHAVKLNRKLNRRTLIKGAAAGLVMAPFYNLLAPKQAKAAIRDKQRVLIFHTQPCNTKEWNPTGYSGENSFTFAPMMAALNEIKQHVVLVDGLSPKQPGDNHFSPHALTGVGREGRPDKGIISIEQFIGDELEKTPNKRPIKNLILGTSAASEAVFYRNNARLQTIASPLSGYNTVFGNMTAGMATDVPQRSAATGARASWTSSSRTPASWAACLGPARSRSWSCTSIPSASSSCASATSCPSRTVSCSKPAAPANDLSSTAKKTLADMAHLELLANAFACDVTRLGAVQWGNSHTWQFDTPTGLRGELHMGIIHVQKIPAGIAIENWLAGQFVSLVKKLQSIPEADGSGTLFDNTLVVWTRDFGDADAHNSRNTKYIFAQGNGGYLKTHANGRYIKGVSGNNRMERPLLNLAEAMGVTNFGTFGDQSAEFKPNKTPLPELRA